MNTKTVSVALMVAFVLVAGTAEFSELASKTRGWAARTQEALLLADGAVLRDRANGVRDDTAGRRTAERRWTRWRNVLLVVVVAGLVAALVLVSRNGRRRPPSVLMPAAAARRGA